MHTFKKSCMGKKFTQSVRTIGFNATVCEKFTDNVSLSTLQYSFKKLPLVEYQSINKKMYSKLRVKVI